MQERLAPEVLQDVVDELTEEEFVGKNLEKLGEYYEGKTFAAEELVEVLSGKMPDKDESGNIQFVKPTENTEKISVLNIDGDSNINAIKEQIKQERRELIADAGELLISFIPVAGPPISVAFGQLIKGEFDAEALLEGFVWGAADLAGVGFLKKIKNIEKAATTIPKVVSKIKITKSVGWRVGEDYNKLTSKGTEPVWSAVKNRFWKNKVASVTPEEIKRLEELRFGNIERMKQGKPPQKYNDKKFDKYGDGWESKELHHDPIPKRDGGKTIEDLWPEEHAAKDKFRHLGY